MDDSSMVPKSLASDRAARKRLGAWYTPPDLVAPLVRWAVRSPDDRVLDPSCGGGSFLGPSAQRLKQLGADDPAGQILGVDIHEEALDLCQGNLRLLLGARARLQLRCEDFFRLEPPDSLVSRLPAVDAVVGNPPFIRYQLFAGDDRRLALQRASRQGVTLPSLSSSWAPFVVHASAFLTPGGRVALVLPAELLHASYAAPIRSFLRRSFRRVTVVAFEDHIFPESQERVVLVLAEGKGQSGAGQLQLATVGSPAELSDFETSLRGAEKFEPGVDPGKWRAGDRDESARVLDVLVERGLLVPLSKVGKAGIGFVTGANPYFVLTTAEVKRKGFPRAVLRPTILSARHVAGARFLPSDFHGMVRTGERCWLWTGGGPELPGVAAHIRSGRAMGIPARYKCRVRKPWYVVPGVIRPDAFLTYMSDVIPRLVLNATRASCSNSVHAIKLSGLEPDARPTFIATFYNAATLLSAERLGRPYGGGVLKLEPSEADRMLVPSSQAMNRISDGAAQLSTIDALLRRRLWSQAVEAGSDVFLRRACGLSSREIKVLRSSLEKFQMTRLAASRSRNSARRRGT